MSDLIYKDTIGLQKRAERLASAVFLVSNLMSDTELVKSKIRQLSIEIVSLCSTLQDASQSREYGPVKSVKKLLSELVSLLTITSVSGLVSEMNASVLKSEVEGFLSQINALETSLPANFFNESSIKDIPVPIAVPKPFSSAEKLNRRDHRNKAVLDIISKKGEVSIKDISSSIKGCSEKTVQRELNALIQAGTIKKTGERRWSRYSLI